ncbi:MAG: ABC transporter ATP-binding protein [Tissierellia bacterium]|nr:ABC transporter ATP-binding protein [Tissierellia bacterium]
MDHSIELMDVYKRFGDTEVLQRMNLAIKDKEFLTLLGPSGCGKTTTLRLIAGFETPTDGKILLHGEDVSRVPAHKRSVNTVFQKYALFTHMNVFENIAFGLRIKKRPENEIKERVHEMLRLVNLKGFENRRTDSLSGGQQQRIAIARALVNEPDVLLLDEPLGALDLKLRQGMQRELKRIQESVGITFVYVTHEQEEALTMSDTVVVMNEGRIQQIGTPIDIYNEPENAFVADFIGESNIIDGVMPDDFRVVFSGREFVCVDNGFAKNEAVDVVVRPEDIEISAPEHGMLKGRVSSVVFKGVHYEMMVDTGDFTYMIHSIVERKEGDTVGLSIIPEYIHIMRKTHVS